MIKFKAPKITADSGGIEIPGGWTVKIPTVQLPEEEERAYVKYLISRGIPPEKAVYEVREAMQALFRRAWWQSLRMMLLDRAKQYIKMAPDLNMAGFDPEELQVYYMPGEKAGREGKPFVKKVMLDMIQRAREEGDV